MSIVTLVRDSEIRHNNLNARNRYKIDSKRAKELNLLRRERKKNIELFGQQGLPMPVIDSHREVLKAQKIAYEMRGTARRNEIKDSILSELESGREPSKENLSQISKKELSGLLDARNVSVYQMYLDLKRENEGKELDVRISEAVDMTQAIAWAYIANNEGNANTIRALEVLTKQLLYLQGRQDRAKRQSKGIIHINQARQQASSKIMQAQKEIKKEEELKKEEEIKKETQEKKTNKEEAINE